MKKDSRLECSIQNDEIEWSECVCDEIRIRMLYRMLYSRDLYAILLSAILIIYATVSPRLLRKFFGFFIRFMIGCWIL